MNLTNSASDRDYECFKRRAVAQSSEYMLLEVAVLVFNMAFKFDDDEAFDDDVIDFGEFKVLIDSMSYPYLYGSTLDFVEDLSGAKFVIENPNAKTTCGCGESFTV